MKIVVVGDSYVYGQGCSDRATYMGDPGNHGSSRHCWSGLLQQRYPTWNVKNYAYPGADNINIVKELQQNLHDDVRLIVFCSTFISRIPARHPHVQAEKDFTVTISPHWTPEVNEAGFNDAVIKYYKHLYSDVVGQDVLTNCLLAAYGAARLIGADFLWTRPVRHQPELNSPIINRFKQHEFKSMSDLDYSADELSLCQHPNNNGHARYFNEVITPLIDNFLQDHNEQ